ncbi:hypothetical protein EHS25_001275 [Saitozyma podzolica]|uniref:Aminotransferase class I/classII large domain-containing protein n=1 Tax=Saitozyma podzolica TaxID=1890683 RepID=A0A427YHV9_9TREE|nr:hypothetical protein EHS25_001275 [Saitozyma podzolica]
MTSQTQAGPASVGRDAPSRLSLQPPCGLPSFPRPRSRSPAVPSSSSTLRDQSTMTIPKSNGHAPTNGVGNNVQHDNDADADIDTETLMSASATPTSALGTREEQRRIYLGPKLSDRATGGPDAGPLIERFSCLFKDQYHCKTNPKGIVSIFSQLIIQGSRRELPHAAGVHRALAKNFLASDLSYGDNLWGSRRINRALSGFYNRYFNPAVEVQPDHIICGNGCSAGTTPTLPPLFLLDQLFFTLLDEGDAILLAAPYYTGFDRDLIGRARVKLVPVHVPEGDAGFSPGCMEAFEQTLKETEAKGTRVRAVILCNPQNPLGRTYPRDTLLAYARFCEERDLHLVSDEIYAMSVYENKSFPDAAPFTSMLSLDVEKELGMEFDKARLHVVYGMSKDFCANGLRIGSLVSQHNPLLLRAMAATSMLMKISSPADVIWSSILSDRCALEDFLGENKRRLGAAQAFVRGWFEERGVEVAHSNAGNFIWVHLGGKLGFRDAISEKKVFQRLLDGGVYIAPGTAYHNPSAGWYRVTFSIAQDDLAVGLNKMEELLDLRVVV